MRITALIIAKSLVVILAASSSSAFGGTLNLSTGLNTIGGLITTCGAADAHWTVTFQGATGPAQVDTPGCSTFGLWPANGPNSAWIAHGVNGDSGPAPYTFSTSFFFIDTIGASLSGLWGIDDGGIISLNGNQLGPLYSSSSLTPVSANSGFLAGVNTLSITMTLSDRFDEGVRFEGSVTGNIGTPSSAPEPGSALLLLAGLAVIAGGSKVRSRPPSRIRSRG